MAVEITRGRRSTPRVSTDVSSAGRDFSAIATGIAETEKAYRKMEEDRGKADAMVDLANIRLDADTSLTNAKATARPGAEGFTDDWTRQWSDYRENLFNTDDRAWSGNRNRAYQQTLREGIIPIQQKYNIEAFNYERTEHSAYQVNKIREAMDTQVNWILNNTKYPEASLKQKKSHFIKDFGYLAAKSESAGDLSVVAPDTGGTFSFGKYQLNAAGKGSSFNSFAKFLKGNGGDEYHKLLKDSGVLENPSSEAGKKAWKQLTQDPVFNEMYEDYFSRTFYEKPKADILKETGIDLSDRSRQVQEAVFSLSINFGQNKDFIRRMFKNGSIKSDEQIIKALYSAARAAAPANTSRYDREEKELLESFGEGFFSSDELLNVEAPDVTSDSNIQVLLSDIDEALRTTLVKPSDRDQLIRQYKEELIAANMTALVQQNPLAAQKVIESGQLDAEVSPATMEAIKKDVLQEQQNFINEYEEQQKQIETAVAGEYNLSMLDAGSPNDLASIEDMVRGDDRLSTQKKYDLLNKVYTQRNKLTKENRERARAVEEAEKIRTGQFNPLTMSKKQISDAYATFMEGAPTDIPQDIEGFTDEQKQEFLMQGRTFHRLQFLTSSNTIPESFKKEMEMLLRSPEQKDQLEAMATLTHYKRTGDGGWLELPSEVRTYYNIAEPFVMSGRAQQGIDAASYIFNEDRVRQRKAVSELFEPDGEFRQRFEDGYEDLRKDLGLNSDLDDTRFMDPELKRMYRDLATSYLIDLPDSGTKKAVKQAILMAREDLRAAHGRSLLSPVPDQNMFLPPEAQEMARPDNPFDLETTSKIIKKQAQDEVSKVLPSQLTKTQKKEALESLYVEPKPQQGEEGVLGTRRRGAYDLWYQVDGVPRKVPYVVWSPDITQTTEYKQRQSKANLSILNKEQRRAVLESNRSFEAKREEVDQQYRDGSITEIDRLQAKVKLANEAEAQNRAIRRD